MQAEENAGGRLIPMTIDQCTHKSDFMTPLEQQWLLRLHCERVDFIPREHIPCSDRVEEDTCLGIGDWDTNRDLRDFRRKRSVFPPQYSCDVCPRSMHSEVHGIDMVWYGINYGLVEWCHHIWSSLYCTYAFAMYIFTMNTCHHSPFSRPGPLSEHSIFIYSPAGSQMTTASSIHTRRQ